MTKIKGKNVLITGGASGIGKIMGRMVLEKGAKSLIIWDVNQSSMQAVADEFATYGRVYIYKVDITNSQQYKCFTFCISFHFSFYLI